MLKQLSYNSVKSTCQDILQIDDLVDLLCLHYIPDFIDYFSMPNDIQCTIERRFCKLKNTKKKRNKEWFMFNRRHGPSNWPAIETRTNIKVWLKSGLYYRRNNLPTQMNGYMLLTGHHLLIFHAQKPFVKIDDKIELIKEINAFRYFNFNQNYNKFKLSNEEIHRPESLGPAVEIEDHTKLWVKNGVLHRTTGPALIKFNNQIELKLEMCIRSGFLHSVNDQCAVYDSQLNYFQKSEYLIKKIWYKHGLLHREGDKPAFIKNNLYSYYVNGKWVKTLEKDPILVYIIFLKDLIGHIKIII